MRQYISNEKYELIKDNLDSKDTYVVVNEENVDKVAFVTNNITGENTKYEIIPGGGSNKTCSFKFNSDGEFQFNKLGYGSYYLKVNDGEWTEYTTSQTVSVVNGDVIELKSNVLQLVNSALSFNDNPNSTTAVSWELEGDLLGTLYGDTFPIKGCFNMFKGCTGLTKVPNDMFANYEYIPERGCTGMFYGCTGLTTAPALPATTLAEYCYQSMFQECTSLTTAPALPATTLADYCYSQMFYKCSGLTTAPALPATTLAAYCYEKMFYNCTGLTTAPELPATTLVSNGYNNMFYGCTSLTTAPALPATTLSNNCYYGMFQGCTSLTTAPELPATTLANWCYAYMFKGCKLINYIKCLATTNIDQYTTNYWLDGVSTTGTFVKAANAPWSPGRYGIPSGWTVEVAA